MNIIKNIVINGSGGLPIALDLFYNEEKFQPLVIYAHGFNGFKDWANFDLIATQFAAAGFCFIKFNFSHNGTTPEFPEDFKNLEAYGNNNYTKELADLQAVIDWSVNERNEHHQIIDHNKIFLIGHSRGGGVVLIKGAEEKRIRAIATWASVSECKTPWSSWPETRIQRWKETGVDYYVNSRTKQKMPLYFQLHEDFQAHKERLNILEATKKLNIPLLICHGTEDEAVPVENAHRIHEAARYSNIFLVPSDHVFGRKHPWTSNQLPDEMQAIVTKTIKFFKDVR